MRRWMQIVGKKRENSFCFCQKNQWSKKLGQKINQFLDKEIIEEILELAGNAARDQKIARIIPRQLKLAIQNEEEFNKFLNGVAISQGGVSPNIHAVLLPRLPGRIQKSQIKWLFSEPKICIIRLKNLFEIQ